MSNPRTTIEDAQFTARTALDLLDKILDALLRTMRGTEDEILYQSISEARQELKIAVDVLRLLNPNGRQDK